MISHTTPRILAIVVTYLPEPERLATLLQQLLTQTGAVLVVDNSPPEHRGAEGVALSAIERGADLRIVRCGENLGIGAALNIGITAAVQEAFTHVLLSDQDSLPDPRMIAALADVLTRLEQAGRKVACVMPSYVDEVTRHAFGFQVQRPGNLFYSVCRPEEARPWIEVLSGITSGSLYPVGVFREVGLMREDYFIDYVDTEWFHRARALGYGLFGTADAVLQHRLGDASFRVWYGRWREFTGYSPARLYYRFRNFVAMYRERHVPLAWKIRAGWYWLGNLYAYVLFSPARATNARYVVRGLVDGLRGRMGKLDS